MMGMDVKGVNHRSNGGNDGVIGSRRQWTSQLSNAEQSISLSSQRLEHAFREIKNTCVEDNGGISQTRSPIEMVRRLTALEIAISQLKQDCETISEKRDRIVLSVIAAQNENIANTEKILQMKEIESSSLAYQNEDASWDELSKEIKAQLDLFNPIHTKCKT